MPNVARIGGIGRTGKSDKIEKLGRNGANGVIVRIDRSGGIEWIKVGGVRTFRVKPLRHVASFGAGLTGPTTRIVTDRATKIMTVTETETVIMIGIATDTMTDTVTGIRTAITVGPVGGIITGTRLVLSSQRWPRTVIASTGRGSGITTATASSTSATAQDMWSSIRPLDCGCTIDPIPAML